MKLILASQSPWRKELLTWLELPFEVEESGVDEDVFTIEEPDALVAALAAAKAEAVVKRLREEEVFGADDFEQTIVLAADTVIVLGGDIIGKPKGRGDAERIIRRLQGREHAVYTGICAIDTEQQERRVEVEKTLLTLRHMSDQEVADYLRSGEWEGKAGAYQIQGEIGTFVTDVRGSVTNVMGLPLIRVREVLESMGVGVGVGIKEMLLDKIGYPS